MFDFTDQVVIVTGAAGDLGRATASAFDEAGASLVLVDHRAGRLSSLHPGWATGGRHLLAEQVDAAEAEDAERLIAGALSRYGRIDVLANLAGGWVGGQPVLETGPEVWQEALRRNLMTAVTMSRAVLTAMVAQERGVILTVGSRQALQGTARNAAYSAAKGALLRFTESLAAEVKGQGVRVNCVAPTTIDTPANRAAMPKVDPAKWATPAAIAGVILFLASPLAADIHGATIPVAGRG